MNLERAIVYVEEGEKEKRHKVEKGVSSILATYPNFVLIEADREQIESLKHEGLRLEIQKPQMIRLRAVEFDPSEKPPPPQPFALSAPEISEKKNFWIVQFVGPAKPEWSEKIKEKGGKLQSYIPDNAFLVEMTLEVKEKVQELPFVHWIGLYEPIYKVSPLLMGRKEKAAPRELSTLSLSTDAFRPAPEGNITVVVHDPSDLEQVSKEIKELGGTIVATGKDVIRTSLDLSQVEKLAKKVEVKWVEPYAEPELFNDIAAEIMGVQPVWENHGLDGTDQIVAVADTGLDRGFNDNSMHEDFRGRIVIIHDRVGEGADDVRSGHGTHVAGSVLGNGQKSGGLYKGIAYAARLVFQAIEDKYSGRLLGIPPDLNDLFQEAYNDGARIHTNSWGSVQDSQGNSIEGQYLSNSRQIDEFMWNHKDMVILFAGANTGRDENPCDGVVDKDSLSIQASAKNCISVGASENYRLTGGYQMTYGEGWPQKFPVNPIRSDRMSNDPEGMAAFSSRGPTDDERTKPDVVAPGTNILSVRSSKATGNGWGRLPGTSPYYDYYMYMGGTSMATPLVAGTVALTRQHLVDDKGRENPSAALIKATLIHGAVSLAGQYPTPEVGPIPDISQGWGRINLKKSLYPDPPVKVKFRDEPGDALSTGEYRDFTFEVVDGSVPFKVTLVWTDYPSSVATGGLVNKLRLSVTLPNSNIVYGSPDINNVQGITLDTPQGGVYTVRVEGMNIATQLITGEKQDFALVVSGGITSTVDLYIRDFVGDTGDMHTGPISASPDIILRPTPVVDPQASFGEGSGTEDSYTLGFEAEAGQDNYLYVRVRNRGESSTENVNATVYWSPVATLITPNMWTLIGSVTIPSVPVGNVLTVSDAIVWKKSDIPATGHYCIVGLVGNDEDPAPDPDDFIEWDNFTQFIREYNNVTWRNFNVVDNEPDPLEDPEYVILPFETPGAPDKSRRMWLEVGAQLPKGSRLWFEVRPNIIDGRHFRERGVDRERDKARLDVKPQGLTKFGARFPFKSKVKAKLCVHIPKEMRNNEYEVFVRQLYRGKEIGRVTWRLVPQDIKKQR